MRKSIKCKWTRPFWVTDCRRAPKSVSSAQAAPLCSVGIERARKCLQGLQFVRCCQGLCGGHQRGSAAVCDPNPPRPFARYRRKKSVRRRLPCQSNLLSMPSPQKLACDILLRMCRQIRVGELGLRPCGPATEPQNPRTPKIRKKYKIPHPGVARENPKNVPKKYRNGPKIAVFGPFLYFFGIFFSDFREPPLGGGFCISFVFSGFWGFGAQ